MKIQIVLLSLISILLFGCESTNQAENNTQKVKATKEINVPHKDTIITKSEDNVKQEIKYEFNLPYLLSSDGNDWAQIDLQIDTDSIATLKVLFHPKNVKDSVNTIIIGGRAKINNNDIILIFNKKSKDLDEFLASSDGASNFKLINDSTIQFDKQVDEIWLMLTACVNWGKLNLLQ